MQSPIKRLKHPLRLAFAASLALHAALLALQFALPKQKLRTVAGEPSSRLDITLAPARPPTPAPPEPQPPTPSAVQAEAKPRPAPPKRILAAPKKEKPSIAQSEKIQPLENPAVKKFLEEIAPPPPPPPPSGNELAQRALAMAQGIAREGSADSVLKESRRANNGQAVDPLSMELYFDAFVRKLNRTAAFVPSEQRGKGADVAVVQVSLNSDGSLKSYRVLTAADQQAEITYVRNVVERAAPFAAFPPDIRSTIDTLSIEICILPPRVGMGGGGAFSRTFGGRDCRDLG